MRVLFLSYQYTPYLRVYDGISIYVNNLTKALAKTGCEVHVVSFGPEETDKYIDGVKVHFFKEPCLPLFRDIRFSLSLYKKIDKLCRDYRIDLVHGNSPFSFGYGLMMTPARAQRLPYALTLHGVPLGEILAYLKFYRSHFSIVKVFGFLTQMLYLPTVLVECRRADRIIAVSKAIAEQASSFFKIPRNKIRVILHGATELSYLSVNPSRRRPHTILFVGRLNWTKGLPYLIKAMPLVLKKYPNAKLQIVGDGSDRKSLENVVAKLKIQESIEFFGATSPNKIHLLLEQASIFVQPSLYESCGIAILEAMSLGKPVVATCTGGIPELIENGKDGLLVKPADAVHIAKAIEKIFSNSAFGKKLGAKAKERTRTELNWEKKAKEVCQVYGEILGGR